ncbi:MAG: CYTH domain-containing protein [Candidatus Pacebacteria bacterium]|nr:CYTH domain-containing protein [Candidatus Paceibacterota bacterium]
MIKKIQYKFKVEKDKTLNIAKLKNIKFGLTVKHIYTYFEIPNKDSSSFTVLRIKTSGGKEKIDMKIRDNNSAKWQHFESDISDRKQMQSILEHINCKVIFTFHKNRQTWIGDFIRLDLDTTKELGTFLEVKFDLKDRSKVERFLQELDIDPEKHDKRSVIEIYLEKYRN